MSRTVAVLVGSLRRDSLSRKVAAAIAQLAPAGLEFQFAPLGALPLYNEDLDHDSPPAEWTAFRKQIAASDALLFVTPEYNRSVPGVLKNAIDVGSRPYGRNAFGGKPGAIVSISVGALAGFGANHHLRQSLVFLDVPTLPQPEAYLGNVGAWFDAQGKLQNEANEAFLRKFATAFAEWIERLAPPRVERALESDERVRLVGFR